MEKINDVVCIEGLGMDSNSYILDNIIVDTGTGLNQDYLYSKLADLKIEKDDIEMIVNTHSHYDHTGGNYLFSNAKVAIHELDAPAIEHENDPLTASAIFHHDLKRHDVDLKIKDGDKIGNFKVIHTPGHTPGGISLWDEEILISGDTVFADGGFGRLDIGGDHDDMERSLNKLRRLDVKYLLPGHGHWTDNGKEHIETSYNSFTNYF
ncbi:MAG: MBL fold metallo-hydrolase [Methanobrevibacter sp.]|jgi:glyoxylase-like metal-dependent hydrolase (beta-lactamase superfamily II)|nr:MBL fold metallo-hydrolase [Candidatus Methanovirga aequatorialis]